MPSDNDYLRAALAGDHVTAVELCDVSLAVVIQKAIRLAHDPMVALTYPQETSAIRERADRQRFRRRLQHRRLEGGT